MSRKQKHQTKPEAFAYTKPQADDILDALRKAGLPEDANHTRLLSEITKFARGTLVMRAASDEFHSPAAKRERVKIRRMTKGAEMLLASIEALSPEVKWSLEDYFLCPSGDRLISNLTPDHLRSLLAYTAKFGENPTRRGRRKKDCERYFVRLLSYIYFGATGRVPSRQNDPITNRARGPFRAFVEAAMKPTGLLRSPTMVDHLIRQGIPKDLRQNHPPLMAKNSPSSR